MFKRNQIAETIDCDNLSALLERISIAERIPVERNPEESLEMTRANEIPQPQNNFTGDLVSHLIANNSQNLQTQIAALQSHLRQLTTPSSVENCKIPTICNELLDVISALPEFLGKPSSYVSWREASNIAIRLYEKGILEPSLSYKMK